MSTMSDAPILSSHPSYSSVIEILEELYDCRPEQFDKISEVLSRFKVITRDKTLEPNFFDKKCIDTLVLHSSRRHTEAQKCISNLILNYPDLRTAMVDPYVTCLEERLTTHKEGDKQYDVLYYDMRIIFLLSALCRDSRGWICDRLYKAITRKTCIETGRICEENRSLVIESLKTLFNLTLDKCPDIEAMSELLQKLFPIVGSDRDQNDELFVNLIHLLTNMPREIYLGLADEDVDKVLNHLDKQLRHSSKESFRDTVLPILNTCANICRYNDHVRRRWFDEIIGSTKDFEKRPEEYNTLRGRLVKLMTSVDVHVKDIAAEFLHTLCGGDTEKFITYTGFGNSAAFLATKGLLNQSSDGKLSSGGRSNSAEDQQYRDLRGKLNPVTGRTEQPKRNPMEGMSEEEKEWHAHELAGAIARLSNLGVIKPMQVSDDNRITELEPRERSATQEH